MRRLIVIGITVGLLLLPGGTASAAKPSGSSSCTGGDGDLKATTLSVNGPLLQISWETLVPLDTPVSRIAVIKASPKKIYNVGLKDVDGEVFRYVAPFPGKQKRLSGSYTMTDTRSTLVVPLRTLPGLGKHPKWYAVAAAGGEDTGRCPAAGKVRF
jgi:hypothetical protein